jgi:hypothetical protein
MKLLVGNTGLIGTTLKDSIKFDYEFNSKNLEDLLTLNIDTVNTELHLCCLPATKWLVNKDPKADYDNMLKILSILSQRHFGTVVLYSTIDVYNEAPIKSNENSVIPVTSLNYGSNRYMFELLIKNTINYKNLLILRLPSLFGNHIKKNILFDLLNKNQIDKINYNSTYQWYNLKNLVIDTYNNISVTKTFRLVNLFPEPIPTSELLKIFRVNKKDTDCNLPSVVYDYTVSSVQGGYIDSKDKILSQIRDFVFDYYIRQANTKVAVCLFGEERNLLSHLENWKNFHSKTNADFYLALYSQDNIDQIIKEIQDTLPVKGIFTIENDLEEFDKLKFKAKHPIYIHGIDSKATFSRITSQLFIRQKAVSLVNLDDYDVILLSRTDNSKFNISLKDIYNVHMNDELLVVNSGTHQHPGGGGGCTECNLLESRCSLEFHANDICDYWCIGSTKVMKNWTSVYDNCLSLYRQLQELMPPLEKLDSKVSYKEKPESNEVILTVEYKDFKLIENYIHGYYPEKIMRVAFKEAQIVNATHDKTIWE